MFLGSNSSYCVEHAPCNVIVVKNDWKPPEEHEDLKKIVAVRPLHRSTIHAHSLCCLQMEEAERKAREQEEQKHSATLEKKKQSMKKAGEEAAALSTIAHELQVIMEAPLFGLDA